eukprot:13101166-Alexandrium_andersonii.AAC.1
MVMPAASSSSPSSASMPPMSASRSSGRSDSMVAVAALPRSSTGIGPLACLENGAALGGRPGEEADSVTAAPSMLPGCWRP